MFMTVRAAPVFSPHLWLYEHGAVPQSFVESFCHDITLGHSPSHAVIHVHVPLKSFLIQVLNLGALPLTVNGLLTSFLI